MCCAQQVATRSLARCAGAMRSRTRESRSSVSLVHGQVWFKPGAWVGNALSNCNECSNAHAEIIMQNAHSNNACSNAHSNACSGACSNALHNAHSGACSNALNNAALMIHLRLHVQHGIL
eukprot:864611-Pelagomonas_calceolata.AAC.2